MSELLYQYKITIWIWEVALILNSFFGGMNLVMGNSILLYLNIVFLTLSIIVLTTLFSRKSA